ncbi:MAG: hypothetical protein ACYSTT_14795, partial [Planctomycetota bacterium]
MSEEWMPHSSLSDFSRVTNIWVKIALGRVKNIADFSQNLRPLFFKPFSAESLSYLICFANQRLRNGGANHRLWNIFETPEVRIPPF